MNAVPSQHASLTREVVHEAGLRRHHPLFPGLAEDGDVALRPLAQRRQATAEALGRLVGLLVGQPVVFSQDHLRTRTHTHKERVNA